MSSERLFKALECEKIQCSFAVVGKISLNSEVNALAFSLRGHPPFRNFDNLETHLAHNTGVSYSKSRADLRGSDS